MLKRTKTSLIVHGLVMLAISLFCFITPQGTLTSLAWIAGLLFILGGVLTFFIGRRSGGDHVSTLPLIAAVLMATVGIVIIVRPNIIAILVGLFVLLEGIDFIAQAVRYHRAGVGHWGALLAAGLLGILLGLWAVLSPWVGATMLSLIIGIGCLCISADCFMALSGIGRVEAFLKGVGNTLKQQNRFEEAEVVE